MPKFYWLSSTYKILQKTIVNNLAASLFSNNAIPVGSKNWSFTGFLFKPNLNFISFCKVVRIQMTNYLFSSLSMFVKFNWSNKLLLTAIGAWYLVSIVPVARILFKMYTTKFSINDIFFMKMLHTSYTCYSIIYGNINKH